MFRYSNRYGMKRRFPFFFFFPLLVLVLSAVIMLLWNSILPEVVHVERISYLQAMGLFILSRILFGGFRFAGRGRPGFGPPPHIREKWMNMSEEERMKFRQEWRARCGRR